MIPDQPEDASGKRSTVEAVLFRALIVVVALAPLPLASNRPLPAALLALSMGTLLLVWSVHTAVRQKPLPVSPLKLRWPLLLFGLCILWILVQSLPIAPAALVDPVWREASEALQKPLTGAISVDPEATRAALMRLLTYGVTFWLALQLTRHPEQAGAALTAAVYIGAAYAIYGIAAYATGNRSILYLEKWAYQSALSSTFVNRNSFATFAGLCLLCAVVHFVNSFSHLLTIDRRPKQRIALIVEAIFGRSILRTVAMLSLMTALALTGSRAGTASSFVALIVLMLTFLGQRSFKLRHILIVTVLVVGGLGAIFAASGGLLAERIALKSSDIIANDRSTVYAATVDAIGTVPWTGTGYGTYRNVFSAYRPETLSSSFFWDKAHNDYLENALELGIPAALALNLAVLLVAVQAFRNLRRRRRGSALPAIGVAATVLVGLHSLLDFSLQMPAVSVLYAFIMGMAVSQSWPRSRVDSRGRGSIASSAR